MLSRILFAVAILLPFCANAQQVKLVNSTEQRWAGGIAGHRGENYTFTIEFSDFTSEPKPLTLWVGNDVFELVTKDSLVQSNTKIKRMKSGKILRWDIVVRASHDDYADRYPVQGPDDTKKSKPKPPRPFKGKALLVYNYESKTQFYEVTKIMTNLPQLNYP